MLSGCQGNVYGVDMSETPTQYYRKELFSSPLYLQRGVRAPFEPVGNDEGILSTNDPTLIFSLESAIAQRLGGVYRVTQEEFEKLKKKEPTTRKSSGRSSPIRASSPLYQQVPPPPPAKPVAAVAANATAKPVEAPATPPPPPKPVRRGKLPIPPPPA